MRKEGEGYAERQKHGVADKGATVRQCISAAVRQCSSAAVRECSSGWMRKRAGMYLGFVALPCQGHARPLADRLVEVQARVARVLEEVRWERAARGVLILADTRVVLPVQDILLTAHAALVHAGRRVPCLREWLPFLRSRPVGG